MHIFLKGKDTGLKQKILAENPNNLKVASIIKAELLYGAEKVKKRMKT